MKNQRGFISPIILVVIALLSVGGSVYIYKNKKIEIFKISEVRQNLIIGNEIVASSSEITKIDNFLFKDSKGVYYISYDDSNKKSPENIYIKGVDSLTFKSLGKMLSESNTKIGGVYKFAYYIDKNNVYFLQNSIETSGEITYVDSIEGADPLTFKVLSATTTNDKNFIYTAVWNGTWNTNNPNGDVWKYRVLKQNIVSKDLKTYINSKYSFSIQYPVSMLITQPQQIFLSGLISQLDLFLIGKELDGVLIAVSDNSEDVKNCMKVPGSKEVVINGVNFIHYNTGDVGAGQFSNVEIYKTLHSSKCFSISGRNSGASPSHYSGEEVKKIENDNKEAVEKIDTIVHSFKFTDNQGKNSTTTNNNKILTITPNGIANSLTVSLTINFSGTEKCTTYVLEFGDGKEKEFVPECNKKISYSFAHQYSKIGTYKAVFLENYMEGYRGKDIDVADVILH